MLLFKLFFLQGEVAQEYDVIKSIMQTLAMFKGENHDTRQVGQGLRSSFASFEEPTRDPDVWPAPPPKDPDVWSGPTHAAQQPEPGRVRPVRGPKKADTVGTMGKSGRTSRTSAVATGTGKKVIASYGQAAAASVPTAKGKGDKGGKKVAPGGAKKDDKNSNEKVGGLSKQIFIFGCSMGHGRL